MKKLIASLILALAMTAPTFAQSQRTEFLSAHHLLTLCNSKDGGDNAICAGYLMGVNDVLDVSDSVISPSDIHVKDLVDALNAFVAAHPETDSEQIYASSVVIAAFKAKWGNIT